MPLGPGCATASAPAPSGPPQSMDVDADYATTPTHDLPNETERDLRARTLSTLLYALRAIDPTFIKNLVRSRINPELAATRDLPVDILSLDDDLGFDDVVPTPVSTGKHSTDHKLLMHLNCVAKLLVREHEIVGVLSKRSGPGARLSMVFTTDSGSSEDSDTNHATIQAQNHSYIFSRNPRSTASPPPATRKVLNTITDMMASVPIAEDPFPLEALSLVSTKEEMNLYLYHHSYVPFAMHVASIEHLFNELILAAKAYEGRTGSNRQELSSYYILRKNLLARYITFRSVGKMHRRFESPTFQRFFKILQSLIQADVFSAVGCHAEQEDYKLTKIEKAKISTLYKSLTSESTPFDEFTKQLSSARKIMHCLNNLVHQSPLAQLHIQSLEPLLCNTITTNTIKEDEEPDDDALELIGAHQEERVGRETLSLVVTFQSSLDVVARLEVLPKQKVSFSYYDALQDLDKEEAGRKTELHDWTGVIKSIFPAKSLAATSTTNPSGTKMGDDDTSCNVDNDDDAFSDDDDGPIIADEVIAAMASYGAARKTRNTFILRSSKGGYSFLGCCHPEATLATMRFLSMSPSSGYSQPPDSILAPFRNTYLRIGVSKRCCPICALLISLLLSTHTSSTSGALSSNPSKTKIIFSYHQNIYPTALPRFLPEKVAVDVLTVMEEGVRRVGEVLVRMAREDKKSKKRRGSFRSVNSGDSKGESPTRSEGEGDTEADGLGDREGEAGEQWQDEPNVDEEFMTAGLEQGSEEE
ncbi:hypothetical protein EV426DRAFT_670882 [Tirmania nivea]|nr:hypothetical protein EV426DRAFT_670882 [Tirmania nivea]